MQGKDIDSKQLKVWLENDEVCLIDVREAIEHESFRIDHSTHISLGEISIEKLPETDKKKVIYCLRGVRGQKACDKLFAEQSDIELYNLSGGINAWKSFGYPTIKSDSSRFGLEQQVQIAIGSLILLSSIIALYISVNVVWLAAVLGLGLIYSGLTGSCLVSMILSKMPWNKR